jgi:hypothetical protein
MTTQSASERKETRVERRTDVPILESDNPFQSKQRGKREMQAAQSKNHRLPSQDGTRGPNKGFRADKPRYDIVFEQKRPVGNQTMRQQQAILLHRYESTAQHRPASACRRACPAWHLDSRSVTGTVSDGVGRPGSGGGLAWANEEARRQSPARAAWSARPLKLHQRQRMACGGQIQSRLRHRRRLANNLESSGWCASAWR